MNVLPQSKKAWWATLGATLCFVVFLVKLSYGPIAGGNQYQVPRTHAINNGKQIFTALYSYAADHDGMFPNEQTALAESNESGDTAEACFNQLLNAGKVDEKRTFWNKENSVIGTTEGTSVPDEDGIITAGENAWGYVRGLTTSSPPETPILFDSSKTAGEFSTQVWEGQAIVVKLNGSVRGMEISPGDKPFGHIYEERDGKKVNLFKDLPEGAEILVPELK